MTVAETVRYSAAISHPERNEFIPFMHRLIACAFGVVRPYFLAGTRVHTKADASPVTAADRGAERALRALIGHAGRTMLYASDGSQRRARVRPCARIEDATLLATSHWSTGEQSGSAAIESLVRRARLYRTWGDCFGYFALASGGADIMLDPSLAYWDVAAIVPVIEGAGGRVSSWRGGDPLAQLSLIATAGPLHPAVLDALAAPR